MKLEFDNLSELDAFLEWAGRGLINLPHGTSMLSLTNSVSTTGETFVAGDNSPADQEARDMKIGPYVAGEMSAPEGADRPKRTRRTKAEIEADKAAQAAVAQGVDAVPAPAAEKPQMTAQEAIQQALAAAELAQQAKAVDAELSQAATAVAGALLESAKVADPATSPTDPKLLPHEFIQKRAAELGELSAIEHLNLARNFIAKHGMPRYNESFTMTGLAANVMAFTPIECATHAAALEWLDKA